MRWALVVGGSISTAACSLFVSLDGLDDGTSNAQPDVIARDGGHPAEMDVGGSDHFVRESSVDHFAREGSADRTIRDGGGVDVPVRDVSVRDTGEGHDSPVDRGTTEDAGLPAYALAVIEAGVYAYWRFEEPDGGVAHDQIHPDAHSGTVTGSIAQGVTGVVGRAVDFYGIQACITIDNGTDFQFPAPQSFSVELWLKPSSFTQYSFVVTTEQAPGSSGRFGWTLGVPQWDAGGPFPQFQGWNDGYIWGAYTSNNRTPEGVATDGGQLLQNAWTYIVGTFDTTVSPAVSSIYVNGVWWSGGSATGELSAAGSLTVGCFDVGGHSIAQAYAGTIDELAVYKRALTQTQILSHYQKAHPP
jgi:hypothetical protein